MGFYLGVDLKDSSFEFHITQDNNLNSSFNKMPLSFDYLVTFKVANIKNNLNSRDVDISAKLIRKEHAHSIIEEIELINLGTNNDLKLIKIGSNLTQKKKI